MKRMIRAAALAGTFATLCVASASASPPGLVQTSPVESAIEQVRDGCGYGYRYSYRMQGCVPERRGPPPPAYVDPAAVAAGVIIGGVAAGIAASQRPVRRAPPPRVRYYQRY